MSRHLLTAILAITASVAPAEDLSPTQLLWKNSFDAERAGNYKSALEYNAAIRAASESYYANLRAGWLNYLLADYKKAIEFYSKASAMAPGAVTPLLGLSNCHVARNDSANAIRVTASVLALDPTNYSANKRLAELYWADKDYSRSAAYYLKLSSLFPEDLDTASSLAWCYLKSGRTYDAGVIFENVLIVNPDHIGAKSGKAALKSGNSSDTPK